MLYNEKNSEYMDNDNSSKKQVIEVKITDIKKNDLYEERITILNLFINRYWSTG